MKEMVMIIRPEKLEIVKAILDEARCGGMTISTVMGCGTQKGQTDEVYANVIKGMKVNINLLPKIRVEVVVPDEMVEVIYAEVRDKVATGRHGDGKIFIRPIENAFRIRTGETGEKAL
ncbi:MAG: P-II family nitrogen regulator [Oscillospiraceae bacterium]|nr:P-II family nitrogen regulator [Oscillospiraceae bacterium]